MLISDVHWNPPCTIPIISEIMLKAKMIIDITVQALILSPFTPKIPAKSINNASSKAKIRTTIIAIANIPAPIAATIPPRTIPAIVIISAIAPKMINKILTTFKSTDDFDIIHIPPLVFC